MVDEENVPFMIVKCADCDYEDDGYQTGIVEQEAIEHAHEHKHKVDVSVQEYFSHDCRKH